MSHRTVWFFLASYLLLTAPTNAALPTDVYGDPLPAGAIARLGTVRWRHTSSDFSTLQFSPDGKLLISAGGSDPVIWDVATGRPVSWFSPPDQTQVAAFTPDGKFVLTEGRLSDRPGERHQRILQQWAVGTGKVIRRVETTRGIEPDELAHFFADGTRFVALEAEDKVALYDAVSGKKLLDIAPQVQYSRRMTLSADSRSLAIIERDHRSIALLDVANGKRLRRIEGAEEDFVYAIALSPDGKLLTASRGHSLCIWDTVTGELRREIDGVSGRTAFSQDGRYFACASSPWVYLFDIASLKEVRRFEENGDSFAYALAFSPDGKLLATAYAHTTILWDVTTGKRVSPPAGHGGVVCSLALAPNGKTLATGDYEVGAVYIWGLSTARFRHRLTGHYPSVVSMAFAPDGKTLATGDGRFSSGHSSEEAQIRLWDVATGRRTRQFTGHLNSVFSLAFSPDGKTLASGGGDARWRLWDSSTGERIGQVRAGEGTKTVAFTADGKGLVLSDTMIGAAVWQPDLGKKLRDLEEGAGEDSHIGRSFVALSGDGKVIYSFVRKNGRDGPAEFLVRELATGRTLRSIPLGQNAPTLSPDGRMMAVIPDRDNGDPFSIEVWDIDTGKLLATLCGHRDHVSSLTFSPDSKTLASGSSDTTVLLWDIATLEMDFLWRQLLLEEPAATIERLKADPAKAVPLMKERLRKATGMEKRVARLVPLLENEDFATREQATKDLQGLGPEAAYALHQAIEHNNSEEIRKRARRALETLAHRKGAYPDQYTPPRLRIALRLLETIDAAQAGQALADLVQGDADATITRQAKASLERREKRQRISEQK